MRIATAPALALLLGGAIVTASSPQLEPDFTLTFSSCQHVEKAQRMKSMLSSVSSLAPDVHVFNGDSVYADVLGVCHEHMADTREECEGLFSAA